MAEKLDIKTINIEIDKKYFPKIIAKQNDTKSRYLLFRFFQNSSIMNLNGMTIRVYAIKSDGHKVFNNLIVDTSNNLAELELTNQMLAAPGILNIELVLYKGESILSTIPLVITVIKSLRDDSVIESTNEFSALQEALKTVGSIDNKADKSYVDTNCLMFKKILNAEDLDSIFTVGFYIQNYNNDATENLHYPTQQAGCLEVFNGVGSNHCWQRYTTYSDDRTVYIRANYGGSWSTWANQDNALMLSGKKLSNNNTVLDRVPYINNGGVMEIGYGLDFHHNDSNNDYDARLFLNDSTNVVECSRPMKSWEFHTQYLIIHTYGNGDYGPETTANIWLDNRANTRLVNDGLAEFLVPQGKVMAQSFENYSDSRNKNILASNKKIVNDLEKVLKIQPKYFEYLHEKNPKKHYGFIAQDLENIIPTSVNTINYYDNDEYAPKDKNGDIIKDFKSIDSIDLIATLWGAVKELDAKIKVLENKNNQK